MMRECPKKKAEAANSWGVQSEGKAGPAVSSQRDVLVGESHVINVLAAGKPVPCTLDMGSQVTLFSQSLFTRYIRDTRVKRPLGFRG